MNFDLISTTGEQQDAFLGLTEGRGFAILSIGIFSPPDQPQGLRRGFAFKGVADAC